MAGIYELRTYVAEEGRLEALLDRFRQHTAGLFERHGMTNVGYWTPVEQPGVLIYLLAHVNADAAAASWEAFGNDPEWKAVKSASEQGGPVVRSITSVYLEPTDFSALR